MWSPTWLRASRPNKGTCFQFVKLLLWRALLIVIDSWATDPDWFTCRTSTVPSFCAISWAMVPRHRLGSVKVRQNAVQFRLTASGPVSSGRHSTRHGYTCAACHLELETALHWSCLDGLAPVLAVSVQAQLPGSSPNLQTNIIVVTSDNSSSSPPLLTPRNVPRRLHSTRLPPHMARSW